MVFINMTHPHDDFPMVNDGPFEWVETIDGTLFGLRPGQREAEELAGMNADGSWNTAEYGRPPTQYRHLVISAKE